MSRFARLSACALATLPGLAAAAAFDVPAGPLGTAVTQLGRQAEVSISVEDPALWLRPVPALRGEMSIERALKRLAEGAGGRLRRAGPRAWRIVASAPVRRVLPRPRPQPIPATEDGAEIIVTASKRDVPLRVAARTVSLVRGADLSLGAPGGTDALLARVASLSSTHLGAGRNKLFIRGIADSSFTGPTQSTVGQYLGDLRLTYNAPDPDLRLFDIADVEILEGPQGTLYGAGSLGGIIRVMPEAPRLGLAGGSITTGLSTTAHGDPGGDVAAMLNLPVAETAALRVVGYGVQEGGYIDNPLLGRRDINRTRVAGGRASLRFDPGDGWSIELGGIGQDTEGRDSQYADRDGPPLTRAAQVRQGFDASYALGQIVVSKSWDDLRFRSSTGYSRQHLRERYDASVPSGVILPGTGSIMSSVFEGAIRSVGQDRLFVQDNRTRLFATESRLWRPLQGGFGWVVGGSFTDNRTRLARAIGPVGAPLPTTGVVNRFDEVTLYGEASVAPLRGLTLTAGARLARAWLAGSGQEVLPVATPLAAAARAAVVADRRLTSLVPSVSVNAAVLPGASLYLRYEQGFRPGGLALEADFVRRFRSDRVATLEAGLRVGEPGRDRFDLSLSGSYTRWKDIQADFLDSAGLPSTANIGDGRIWSLSGAGGFSPVHGLRLEASATYNDSEVTEPAPVLALAFGRMSRVPNVAGFAGRIGVDYQRELSDRVSLRVNGWARYVGRSRLGVGPVLGEAQGDYLDTALTLRIGRPDLGLTLGATNLTDEIGNRFALGTPFPIGRGQITPLRPRTLRLGLDASF